MAEEKHGAINYRKLNYGKYNKAIDIIVLLAYNVIVSKGNAAHIGPPTRKEGATNMTAREYAKACGVSIVGKLTKTSHTFKRWDWAKGKEVTARITYYVDEAGTEIHQDGESWSIVAADGGVM